MILEPSSIEQCVYFTNRSTNEGKIKAWAYKKTCPNCKKSLMSKPKDSKGKIKIRAKEYVCEMCNLKMTESEYEGLLSLQIKYTCQYCKHTDQTEIPFVRKKVRIINPETGKKYSVEVLRFQCSGCSKAIDITKKMKGL